MLRPRALTVRDYRAVENRQVPLSNIVTRKF